MWPHLFPSTLDDLPNKWYKIKEARGDTFTWKKLKHNFIKDFSFFLDDENLQPATKQIKQFLETNTSNKIIENKPTKECQQVLVEELQHSTRLQLQSNHLPGKIFRLTKNHPLGKTEIKTLYKISTEQKLD